MQETKSANAGNIGQILSDSWFEISVVKVPCIMHTVISEKISVVKGICSGGSRMCKRRGREPHFG